MGSGRGKGLVCGELVKKQAVAGSIHLTKRETETEREEDNISLIVSTRSRGTGAVQSFL